MSSATDLADPRSWPAAAGDHGFAARVHAAAEHAIAAATGRDADAFDAQLRRLLEDALARGDGRALADALEGVPSVAVARHLRRLLAALEEDDPRASAAVRTALFAIPVIIVAALEDRAPPVTLSGALPHPGALAEILREARAFGGSETFALAGSLTGADAIDIAALPALLARARATPTDGGPAVAPVDLPPEPVVVRETSERVHLRFVAGAVVAAPRADPLAESGIGRWGMAFARAVADPLRAPGLALLALPRPAQRFVAAVQSGRAAQREVSAQIFAANAIRKFRASHGEPTAIISAHRAAGAPGAGELRLSLSSPFAPKEAEGFRCPVYAYEAVRHVGAMLDSLMRDCRVTDVRFLPGIHPDGDPITGGPLFFKNAGADPLH